MKFSGAFSSRFTANNAAIRDWATGSSMIRRECTLAATVEEHVACRFPGGDTKVMRRENPAWCGKKTILAGDLSSGLRFAAFMEN